MAYQPQRREVPCAVCRKMATYFKLIESWRPEHQYAETMNMAQAMRKEPATRRRGKWICPT
eukprot:9231835-Prorocentrum_lima.AAC.1